MRTPTGTMQPRVLVATALVIATMAISASAAMAAPLCRSAMFQCRGPDNITHGKNLVVLIRDERRSLRWILKRCGEPVDRHPFRCDWKRSVRTGKVDTSKPGAVPSLKDASPKPASHKGAAPAHRAPAAVPHRPVPSPRATRFPLPAPPRAPSLSSADRGPYTVEIAAAARRYRLPGDLIRAVIKIESNFKHRAVSIKGAQGLMQLMPVTARTVGVTDPFDPAQNIMGGARLLRILANRFNGDLIKVLSAFHAGSSPVKDRGGTPFASTDSYVRKVLSVYYALRDS